MKIKKSLELNTLPLTFYAHTMQFIDRDPYDNRCAVTFEAVLKDNIHMFISGKSPQLPPVAAESRFFKSLWAYFQRGGLSDENFLTEKAIYLAEAGNAEIAIMLPSFSKAKELAKAKNDWWEITIYPPSKSIEKNESCLLDLAGYALISEEFPFGIAPVSRETEQILYKLYTPYIDGKTTGKYITESEQDALGTIIATTTFSQVRVLYVGAGLCCCIVDGGGNPICYFDMGEEDGLSARRLTNGNVPGAAAMHLQKQGIVASVQLDITNHSPDVIISHWHNDHTKILNNIAVNFNNYQNFWANTTIYSPGLANAAAWGHMHCTAVQGAMLRAGSGIRFTTAAYQNNDRCLAIHSPCPNLAMCKSDRQDGHLTRIDHHNHALAALITLVSGNTVFLAGDSYYDTLSVNNPAAAILRNGYNNLIACHHGGKYAHTGAQNRAQYIPVPVAAHASKAFYSANGIAYGHPNAVNTAAYTAAGWINRFTHELPATGNGYYIIL